MFSQYHSYLFDDRTLAASAALRKRAMETDPSQPKVFVVNYKRATALLRKPDDFDRMLVEEWGITKL